MLNYIDNIQCINFHMSTAHTHLTFNKQEERINALTHGLGTVLALVAALLLLKKGVGHLTTAQTVGLTVYSMSMVMLFLASTLYHSIESPKIRVFLKQLDHSAIYLLIAGTYTPFLMISLTHQKAHVLLWVLWALAALGVVFKLLFIHRFPKVSLAAYLMMGWLALVIIPDIYAALPRAGFFWLIVGGVSYTVGTIFYAAKNSPYTHAIWHIFVLAGAASHCWAIYHYVLP